MGVGSVMQHNYSEKLISCIAELDEKAVNEIVMKRINLRDDPLNIIEDCQQGMRLVGKKYENGQYYIAGLIMAGEIFRQVVSLLQPMIIQHVSGLSTGTVLLGTVQNDIHDLGKNIVYMLLKCNGFHVCDLGVDVSPGTFIEKINTLHPDVVGLSCLLTASYDKMRETVALIKNETKNWQKPPFIVIGGNQINAQISNMVGTKYWTNDAIKGVKLIKNLLEKKSERA